MNTETEQDNQSTPQARYLFDQTLKQHIERLIGSPYGIGGLPLNVVTLSCFILLTEQVKNEMDNFSTPSERFTQASLIQELKEIGLPRTPDLEAVVQEMTQKGYMGIDESGKLYGKKPTLSMAQLLDHTFPKMPGMNLIAYLIQTLDEVNSGRKDPAFAIRQFDETLKMQGVQLKKEKKPLAQKLVFQDEDRKKSLMDERPTLQDNPPESQRKKDPLFSESYGTLEKENALKSSKAFPSESKIISSEGCSDKVQIKEITFGTLLSEQNTVDTSYVEVYEELISATDSESNSMEAEGESWLPESLTESSDRKAVSETGNAPFESSRKKTDLPFDRAETISECEPEGMIDVTPDDTVERHIIDFEEDLAMQCPLCKVKKVQIRKTITGKTYYLCANKNCHFISWGKPYHLACPRCHNPFLIEIADRDNVPILKCPRATCHYWQKSDGEGLEGIKEIKPFPPQADPLTALKSKTPRRRFVRKRVVRRK